MTIKIGNIQKLVRTNTHEHVHGIRHWPLALVTWYSLVKCQHSSPTWARRPPHQQPSIEAEPWTLPPNGKKQMFRKISSKRNNCISYWCCRWCCCCNSQLLPPFWRSCRCHCCRVVKIYSPYAIIAMEKYAAKPEAYADVDAYNRNDSHDTRNMRLANCHICCHTTHESIPVEPVASGDADAAR